MFTYFGYIPIVLLLALWVHNKIYVVINGKHIFVDLDYVMVMRDFG